MKPRQIIETVLKHSQADEAIVIIGDHDRTNIRWANSGLTTNGHSQHGYIAVISIIGKRAGTHYASLNSSVDLEGLARLSEEAARQSPISPDYMPLVKGGGVWPSTGATRQPALDGLAGLTRGLELVFKKAQEQKLAVFGYADLSHTGHYLATSAGVRKYHRQTEGQFELNAKTLDLAKSVWTGAPLRNFSQIDPLSLFAELETKLAWSETEIHLPAGKYEVILEPSAVADMLLFAYWESSARQAEDGHSAYSRPGGTVIGQPLYRPDISVFSDPTYKNMGTVPFDITYATNEVESIFDNGLSLNKTFWIKDGRQQNLIATRYLANQKKYPKPTPFIPNLLFVNQGDSLEEMVKSTKNGLLVTCFWYMREVDPQNLLVTGLTRDGLFLIKNGQVAGAVNNFRFNMSPLSMLKQVAQIGQSQSTLAREFGDYFSLTVMPPLRVKDFNMSSVSQAK